MCDPVYLMFPLDFFTHAGEKTAADVTVSSKENRSTDDRGEPEF